MKYLLCGQPEIMSAADLLEWQSDLLALDQRDEGVIIALEQVREEIAYRESQP